MFSRKKKFFVLSITLLCAACLLFTGCGNSNNNTPPANNSQTDDQNKDVENTDGIEGDNMSTADKNSASDDKTNPTDKAGSDMDDMNKRAEKIADAVTNEIAQVKDSRVVISEKMAYVSVSIDETADATESMDLKEEISQVTKKTDSKIETVYVMEDADTFTRMKEIGDEIADGKPVSGFMKELENMFVRVAPTAE